MAVKGMGKVLVCCVVLLRRVKGNEMQVTWVQSSQRAHSKNTPHLTCTGLESGSAQSWGLRREELQMAGGPPRPYSHLGAAAKEQERNPMTFCSHYVIQLLPDHEAHYPTPTMPTSSLLEPCGAVIFNTAFTITQCHFNLTVSPESLRKGMCIYVLKAELKDDHSESSHILPVPTPSWG